jgi:hypothetical protein
MLEGKYDSHDGAKVISILSSSFILFVSHNYELVDRWPSGRSSHVHIPHSLPLATSYRRKYYRPTNQKTQQGINPFRNRESRCSIFGVECYCSSSSLPWSGLRTGTRIRKKTWWLGRLTSMSAPVLSRRDALLVDGWRGLWGVGVGIRLGGMGMD